MDLIIDIWMASVIFCAFGLPFVWMR